MQPRDIRRGRDPFDRRDPYAVPPASRRTEILASGALNVLLGGWLAASPIVLGYDAGDPRRHDILLGLAIATIAAVSVGRRPWRAWTGWLNAGLGLWLFAAAFWAAESAAAAWNEAIVGALVAALASIAASATEQAQRAARS